MLKADGFDEAIIGTAMVAGNEVIAYSAEKCIEVLIAQGMSDEEALEYFEFNVSGAYVGPETPVYVYEMDKELVDD